MVESNGEFCLPAAGADALNTAARDDPDRMRQTDRQFARQGGTLQKAEDKYIWTPPLMPGSPGDLLYNIQVSGSPAKCSTV